MDSGNFDRDRLDHSMHDIESVMNNAWLDDHQRNALREDLRRLHELRDQLPR